MPTFTQTLDVFLNIRGQQNPAQFFTSTTATNTISGMQFVQGDNALLRLWLVVPPDVTNGTPSMLARANGPIAFALKKEAKDAGLLAFASEFTLVDNGDGEHYETALNLKTDEINAAFSALTGGDSFSARLDIEFQSVGNTQRLTFIGAPTLFREGYQGSETIPVPATPAYPPPGDIPSRMELQQILLNQRQLALGGQSWYNSVTGKWHKVFLTGEAGHETYAIDPNGYDSPELIPDVSDPLSWEVTYAVSPISGTQEVHFSGDVAGVSWLNAGSLFTVGSHGRAALVSAPVSISGTSIWGMTLRFAEGWTGGAIAVGERVTLMRTAGIQGIPGTVYGEARIAALEAAVPPLQATARGLGGIYSATGSGSGSGGMLFASAINFGAQSTIAFDYDGKGVNGINDRLARLTVAGYSARLEAAVSNQLSIRVYGPTTETLTLSAAMNFSIPQRIIAQFNGNQVRGIVNGVPGVWQTSIYSTGSNVSYLGILTPQSGAITTATGWTKQAAAWNYLLSESACADYFRYGVAAGDRIRDDALGNVWTNNPSVGWATFSASGRDVVCSATAGTDSYAFLSLSVPPGKTFTLVGTCDGWDFSGGNPFFAFSVSTQGASQPFTLVGSSGPVSVSGGLINITGVGDFSVTVALSGVNPYLQLRSLPAASGSFSLKGLRPGRCVLDLTPDSVSPKGRWVDMSGQCNDARTGENAIITPLSPRPQRRQFAVSYPMIQHDSSGPGRYTVAATATGLDALALAAIRAGDSLEVSFGAGGIPASLLAHPTAWSSVNSSVSISFLVQEYNFIPAGTLTITHNPA